MNASAVELFAHAAERAKDVAVMMEAARALTVLGRTRLGDDADASGKPAETMLVVGLYQTAERLGQHVRQVSGEARSLLLTARKMLDAEPATRSVLPVDFHEVCHMMDDAMDRAIEAVERLDAMRLEAVPRLLAGEFSDGGSEPVAPSPEALQAVDGLMQRLRRGGRPLA